MYNVIINEIQIIKRRLLGMEVAYFTNGVATTKSMTEWFFGKKVVGSLTASAIRQHETTKRNTFKFWQDGTGYLGIQIS